MTDVSVDYAVLRNSAMLLHVAARALSVLGAREGVRGEAVPTATVRRPLEVVGVEQAARASATAEVLLGAVRLLHRTAARYQHLDRTVAVTR